MRTELKTKEKEFKNFVQLNRGSYGKVYKCTSLKDNKIYALKIIDNIRQWDLQFVQKQAITMSKCKSKYILELVDNFYDKNSLEYIFVFPFCQLGNLASQMNKIWNQSKILLFLYQIVHGFIDINKNDVWHLDLKPQNILLKSTTEYLICDFGCAQHLENPINSFVLNMSTKGVGTPQYAAPELVLYNNGIKQTDVWSLGVILYKIIYQKHPLLSESNSQLLSTMQQFEKNQKIKFLYRQDYQDLIDICKKLLRLKTNNENELQRIGWTDIMKEIFNLIKISPEIPIITDLNELLIFYQDIYIILSGLIHYIEEYFIQCKQMTNSRSYSIWKKLNISTLVATIGNYLFDFHLYIYQKTQGQTKKTNNQILFIFRQTKEKKQESFKYKLGKVRSKIQRLSLYMNIQKNKKPIKDAYQLLISQLKQFYKKIILLHEEMVINPIKQWWKVEEIVNSILSDSILNYDHRQQLHKICYNVINM